MSEDLDPSGDITTQLIKDNKKIKAKIIANENCIIGGLNFAKEAFKYSDKRIVFKFKTKDGRKINPANFYYNDLTPDEYEKMLEISSQNNQSFD